MFEFQPEHKKSETVAARNLGEKIAKMYGGNPPIQVKEIITSKYQIEIIELELDPSISAIVDLDSKEIMINSTQGHQRGRFTLAHELGHIVLNHGYASGRNTPHM
ncbi:ImmA/IrrE family metallo-endopeptidase [Paenibacillus sp. B01]|uniref:ImmA/IrrE family metallo-endopeptidase n=1 Tax=Paenibacillus sp. B01 TaxID=2660554 RepID=UPI00129B788D|nr:ImmA/IrrE family metallo-endopeptidase [Paenibacillus sp. B01]QGG57837.1 ImmA/IrrE family metallo-endopeptidase [Paenibacillus sp. B01]